MHLKSDLAEIPCCFADLFGVCFVTPDLRQDLYFSCPYLYEKIYEQERYFLLFPLSDDNIYLIVYYSILDSRFHLHSMTYYGNIIIILSRYTQYLDHCAYATQPMT